MIAQSLYDKTYDLEYRVQTYEPYREINDLATEMKTSGYNPFENPTGIYFKVYAYFFFYDILFIIKSSTHT